MDIRNEISAIQVYLLAPMNRATRDAASRKIDHIALPTMYNYHATSIG